MAFKLIRGALNSNAIAPWEPQIRRLREMAFGGDAFDAYDYGKDGRGLYDQLVVLDEGQSRVAAAMRDFIGPIELTYTGGENYAVPAHLISADRRVFDAGRTVVNPAYADSRGKTVHALHHDFLCLALNMSVQDVAAMIGSVSLFGNALQLNQGSLKVLKSMALTADSPVPTGRHGFASVNIDDVVAQSAGKVPGLLMMYRFAGAKIGRIGTADTKVGTHHFFTFLTPEMAAETRPTKFITGRLAESKKVLGL